MNKYNVNVTKTLTFYALILLCRMLTIFKDIIMASLNLHIVINKYSDMSYSSGNKQRYAYMLKKMTGKGYRTKSQEFKSLR